MPKKARGKSSLGQSLVSSSGAKKSASQTGRSERRDRARDRHGGLDATTKEPTRGFASVLEVSDLSEIMMDATLEGRDFRPERRGPVVYNSNPDVAKFQKSRQKLDDEGLELLRLPRRPKWSKNMTHKELEDLERNSFLTWRRGLAAVEEATQGLLTPFEKNLEIWRQLWRVIERSDVLVQIVDARDPLLYYCEDLDRYVDEMSTPERKKKRVLVLNKADLLPDKVKVVWLSYFRSINVEAVLFSALAAQDEILEEGEETAEVSTSKPKVAYSVEESNAVTSTEHSPTAVDVKVLNRSELVDYFRGLKPDWKISAVENHEPAERSSDVGRENPANSRVVVGMIGYPNVGKSSTINSIMGTKKVSVSSTPGRTKHLQTLLVDESVMLCDCPGLVFPNFAASQGELITRGILPIDNMQTYDAAMEVVSKTIPRATMEQIYGIKLPGSSEYGEAIDLLEAHARARGFRNKHDQADRQRSARIILKDYVNGKLVYCAVPAVTTNPGQQVQENEEEEEENEDLHASVE